LHLLPAPPDTGIVFVRTDLDRVPPIRARVDEVTGTNRRTTLGRAPNQVSLVEHTLAALAGMRIDNCTIRIDGPEPPGLDGSALPLVERLYSLGTALLPVRRRVYTVESPLKLSERGATLAIYPGEELKISYLLDYGLGSPIDRQMHTEVITPEGFANGVAGCRTFLHEREALEMRRQGIGVHASASDLLVFGPRGPIGNRLRHANEPARHKILDLIGDLSLFGHDLRGHVVAYRSGHPLNVLLAQTLCRRLEDGGGRMAA
jgi:UDP-3-O-acyl-N-acetylglucosamine deacetylase